MSMNKQVLSLQDIFNIVKPLAEKYHIKEVYIFGSYARGEADCESDVDVLAIAGDGFSSSDIFAFGEELRIAFGKSVDAYEMQEINVGSDFYKSVMRDRVKVT